MKLSTFPLYGAKNSKEVFEAFESGAKQLGHNITQHNLDADAYVIWSMLWINRMKENATIWKEAVLKNKPVIILEVGGLKRGITWRCGLGGINGVGYFGNDNNLDLDRSKKLGLHLNSWRTTGDHILVCSQNTKSEQWRKYPLINVWFDKLVDEIRAVSKRPIVLRPHPRDYLWTKNINKRGITVNFPNKIKGTYDDFNHHDDFKNAWCIINPCSNPGIQSIIHGIPAFVDQTSLAYPVGNTKLSTIEKPNRPDRKLWFEQICHTEWTLPEIESGIPLQRLMEKLLTTRQ